jgi:hypothetical protein
MKLRLEYTVGNQQLVFWFNQDGDLISYHLNGNDQSENGEAIEHALTVVAEAGHNIQKDISYEAYRQHKVFYREGYA